MLNWFRQWRINGLLIEVKRDEAIQRTLAKLYEVDEDIEGRIAANKERLRQLGHEEKKTVVRIGLPENYLKKMLDETNKIAGEQDNG